MKYYFLLINYDVHPFVLYTFKKRSCIRSTLWITIKCGRWTKKIFLFGLKSLQQTSLALTPPDWLCLLRRVFSVQGWFPVYPHDCTLHTVLVYFDHHPLEHEIKSCLSSKVLVSVSACFTLTFTNPKIFFIFYLFFHIFCLNLIEHHTTPRMIPE